jgi:hypothetical protein
MLCFNPKRKKERKREFKKKIEARNLLHHRACSALLTREWCEEPGERIFCNSEKLGGEEDGPLCNSSSSSNNNNCR